MWAPTLHKSWERVSCSSTVNRARPKPELIHKTDCLLVHFRVEQLQAGQPFLSFLLVIQPMGHSGVHGSVGNCLIPEAGKDSDITHSNYTMSN